MAAGSAASSPALWTSTSNRPKRWNGVGPIASTCPPFRKSSGRIVASPPHRHGRIVTAASSPAISLAKLFRS
jgi:hypothetical protein